MRILVWLLLLPGFLTAQPDCKQRLNKDSIVIYTCNTGHSKFKAVKTTFTVNARMSKLAAFVMDIDTYMAWQYKALSARTLKKVSPKELIYYTEVKAPVLTSNRDFVIKLTMDQNPTTKILTIDAVSIPDYLPKKDGVIRVPFSKAQWTVKPIAGGKLEVTYFIELDLGGDVPAWMVNAVAPEAPYETFKALKSVIKKYKGKATFIKD